MMRYFDGAFAASLILCACATSLQAADPVPPEALRSSLSVVQWVKPAQKGQFDAQVVLPRSDGGWGAVEGIAVQLYGANQKRYRGVTQVDGKVTLEGVPPGRYTLTARGKGMIAWYAMHVVAPDQAAEGQLPTVATISPALISPRRFESLVLPHVGYAVLPIETSIAEVDITPILGQLSGEQFASVTLGADTLPGRILRPALAPATASRVLMLQASEASQVWLLDAQSEVISTNSDSNGLFQFGPVASGVYSLVAAGPNGVAALSFPVVSSHTMEDLSVAESNAKTLVGRRGPQECGCVFQVAPLPLNECHRLLSEPCSPCVVTTVCEPTVAAGGGAPSSGAGMAAVTGVAGGGSSGIGATTTLLGGAASGGSFTGVDSFVPPAANTPSD